MTNAVTGRQYGTPQGSQDLTYMVAAGEGLPTVMIMGSGFPTPITCPTQANAADSTLTLTCNSGGAGVTGSTATGTITLADTADATTPAATVATDPASVRNTDSITVVPELTIGNTFLENGTVGEPYSAIFYSNNGGIPSAAPPPAYTWSTTAGGIAGVVFVNPSPLPTDDATQQRGYYVGTPTTASTPGTPTISTTFTVTDSSNPTTPNCTTATTCPTFTTTNKVLPEYGFVATFASGAAEMGSTVVSFDSNGFSPVNFISLRTSAVNPANPVAARVSPDGEWVYAPKQGNTHDVSVVDSISTVTGCVAPGCAASDLAVNSIVVSNTGTFNPSAIDIGNQKFFSTAFACGTPPCSVQRNFRYDAWLSEPTDGAQASATVEPIPDAEDPGLVPTTLSGADALIVPNANNISLSTDGSLAFLSLNYLPSGTCVGANPPCTTFSVLSLPTTPIAAAPTVATTLSNGLRAGGIATDPRGNYVYTATRDNTGAFIFVSITTASAGSTQVNTIPTVPANVCANGDVVSGLTASPDGNRLFVNCLDVTNTPQINNAVQVYDISAGDLSTVNFTAPVATISLPVPPGTNPQISGCETPVDIKARLTGAPSGTRLFVSCQDSDTIIPIEYNIATDVAVIDPAISTDPAPLSAAPTNPCGNGGSCPQLLDLMVDPALHFTTGGFAPASPFALPSASLAANPYATFIVAAGGTVVDSTGAVKRTWSNPDGVLASDPNCAGLTLNPTSGEISGTAAGTAGTTCGGVNGFIIRVTDASVLPATPAGQFVERNFTIPIVP